MSILALNKVNYSYKNGKKVLNDISMEFEKGKFYAILGVSGSGKTTLLSLLAGLDEPRNGEILYNNQNIKVKGYENHRKSNISLIFQNYNLIDYMTPLENLKIVNPKADKKILNDLGLTDDEVNEMLKEIIASGNYTAADMGKIMKEIMPKVSGKFDRSKINPMVKALL